MKINLAADTIGRENVMVRLKTIPKVSATSPCVPTWLEQRKWTCIAMNVTMEDPPTHSPKWVTEEVMDVHLPRKSRTAAIVPLARALPSTAWTIKLDSEQTLANHTLLGPPTIKSLCRKKRSRVSSMNSSRNSGFKW